jgi:hypothetical protein
MTSTIRITLAHDPDLRRELAAERRAVRREFVRDQQARRRECATDYRAAYAAERQAELEAAHQEHLREFADDRREFFGEDA